MKRVTVEEKVYLKDHSAIFVVAMMRLYMYFSFGAGGKT